MNTNRITYVPDPLTNNEPVTKQYGDRTHLTDSGFVMGLGTPTNDTDVANKKYVEDKKCKFKDGTTTTSDIDLRSDGFHNDVTFHAGATCQDINSSSSSNAIINKNSLETGHLITLQSLSPALAVFFSLR